MRRLFPVLLVALAGCASDPGRDWYIRMKYFACDDERPPNWAEVKALMDRRAPWVGQAAPDFELPTVDGRGTIRRSEHQAGRPQVLIFGSYT